MTQIGNCLAVELKPKQMLLRDILENVGDSLHPETVAKKVTQYYKHGNIFLFFEVMSLRKELEKMREQISALKAQ